MSEIIVEHNCGIYKIINTINGKFYIGSSKNLKQRKVDHYKLLRNNKHNNSKLQNSFNKYKDVSFKFIILFFCDEVDLELYENRCIWSLCPELNIEKSATRRAGDYKPSADTLRKLSESHKGKPSGRLGKKLEKGQIDLLRIVNLGNSNACKSVLVNLMSPNGTIFMGPIYNLRKFCRDNGIKSNGTFLQFLKGKKGSYLGWRII